jgi:uncharacterized protein (DUF427 family)
MSLATADGPLSAHPADSNYEIEGPAHKIFWHPITRRIRAELAGETVVDTREARLLYETGYRARLYVPLADVRSEAIEPSERTSYCPFKGTASYRTLRVGDRVAEDAVWVYDEPNAETAWLEGYGGVYEDRFDRWLDEEDEVLGHLPDPFHRVDIRHSTRTIRVTGPDLAVLAETSAPLVLSETGIADRIYIPRADVRVDLQRSEKVTVCPYKGTSTYWSAPGAPDVAWSYEHPLAESSLIAGYLSFDGEGIEVTEYR